MDIKKNLKSTKTTIAGIIAGLLVILPQLQAIIDNNPDTNPSIEVILTGLAMMGIGVLAKDGDKSTEDVSE